MTFLGFVLALNAVCGIMLLVELLIRRARLKKQLSFYQQVNALLSRAATRNFTRRC